MNVGSTVPSFTMDYTPETKEGATKVLKCRGKERLPPGPGVPALRTRDVYSHTLILSGES